MRPIRCLIALGATGLTLLAAGCGGEDGAPAQSAGASTRTTASGTFPATVRHRFGTTTVTSEPKRVVVVGLREQDSLLALGIDPVATTEWFGKDPGALEPWARAKLAGRPLPTVLPASDSIDIERVAAQRPDLIVGIDSAMTRSQYRTLSKLAPTVAPPAGVIDYGSSWQQHLEMVGAAVGRPQEAARLEAAVDAQVAALAAKHPRWRGRTFADATNYQGIFVYGPKTASSQLLARLGLQYAPALRDVGGADGFGGELSGERIDLLDVDALVWEHNTPADRRAILKLPGLADLPVNREGREIFMQQGSTLYDALGKTSVLSVPVALQQLEPRLDAALDGDPATSTDVG